MLLLSVLSSGVNRITGQVWRPPMKGVRGSDRDVREYVSVDQSARTNVVLVVVGNAGAGFNFPDVGQNALFVSSFDEVAGVV